MKLAREAREISGRPVFVAGSIGPLGELDGTHGGEDAYDVFLEQARLLEGRGVDLFMVETFFDLEELETAVAAVRAVSSLPIVAQLTFDEDAETLAGVSARRGGRPAQRGRGRRAIGANCGVGPQAALAALARDERGTRTGCALPRSRTSACRAAAAGASSTRTRRPTTSPSSPRRRATSARGSSAAAAGRGPAQIAAIRAAVEEQREPRVALRRDRARRGRVPVRADAERRRS